MVPSNPSHARGKRTWGVWTRDFVTLGQPYVVFDPGYNAIDTTLVQLPNRSTLALFKDERFRSGGEHIWSGGRHLKSIRHALATSAACYSPRCSPR